MRMMTGLSIVVVIAACTGCDRRSANEQPRAQDESTDLPLLDPEVKKTKLENRCLAPPGAKPSTLRAVADGKAGKVPAEVGMGIAVKDGFVVSGLTSGSETNAFVFFTNGRGAEKRVDLGRVHGAVEAPLLASYGPHLLVAVIDNDAMNTRIRLAKVEQISSTARVTWGPEVQAPRDESTSLSIAHVPGGSTARALLVWDHFDRAASRSRVQGLWFSPDSMKAMGVPETLSGREKDVVEPRLLARRSGGAWLSWLAYGKMNAEFGPREGDAPLVSEPSRWLEVQKLGAEETKWGNGLQVSPEHDRVLTYDIGSSGEELVIVYRGDHPGDTSESAPLDFRVVGQDGSVRESRLQNRDVGPGAPLILSPDLSGSPWLLAKGQDLELLWVPLDGTGTVTDLREEPVLEGQIPLARRGSEMLLMKPEGLDLQLSVWECREEKRQPASSSSPVAPSPSQSP